FRATNEIEAAGTLALHVAVGRLLVVRVELEQRRVVGLLLRLLRVGGRCVELRFQVVFFRGGHRSLLRSRRSGFRATLARDRRRAQRDARNRRIRLDSMTAPQPERLSAVDTAWLRMDRPSNRMMICGVLLFREKIAFERFKKVIDERFLIFGRFRQRAVETAAGARWENDPAFDLDRHVVRVTLPGKAGTRELEALVSRLISTPLDPARPMWQFCVVDNFAGGSAVILRIHHCYADGIALVRVMLSMTDSAPNGPPAMPFEPRPRSRKQQDELSDDALSQLAAPFADVIASARKIGGSLIEKGVQIWNDPA